MWWKNFENFYHILWVVFITISILRRGVYPTLVVIASHGTVRAGVSMRGTVRATVRVGCSVVRHISCANTMVV